MNVLVAIRSYCSNHDAARLRREQKYTWLNDLSFPYLFFVGNGEIDGPTDNMVQLPCSDSRDACSTKTHHIFQYAYDNAVDYLFLCDSDTFAVPSRLEKSGFECFDYSGYLLSTKPGNKPFIMDCAAWFSRKAIWYILFKHPLLDAETHAADLVVGRLLFDCPLTVGADNRYVGFKDGLGDGGEQKGMEPRAFNGYITAHPCKTDMPEVFARWKTSCV